VQRFDVGAGQEIFLVLPADWEQLRHEEGGAGRPVPYWARPWPSGLALAAAVAADPPRAGARVLELGCGLGAPSIVAARAGARVLATDGAADAVAFAAHSLALNEVDAEVAHADWTAHGDALVARGPFDVVLAADVLYTRGSVEAALRLWPRLVAPGGVLLLADPERAGAREMLAAARARFHVVSERRAGAVALHVLRPRGR
jgi:predicted nicotinamide N-methyase